MSTIDWTTERTNTLIALWNEGLPTSEIGRRLEVTKNAVVGKVHRLGLKKRASPIRAASAPSTPKTERRKEAPTATEAKIVRLDALTSNMCSWPEGEPGTSDFHFCGSPAVTDKPYCAAHCARAYVRTSKGARSNNAKNAASAGAAA
ncbi:GcrA family cell cycle regulator [Varunaivibrio sulfuroxidans]|uniref:GcrA cell cycle regulator n=1 Tax=Varunaivibrio sulfuroxidans TaxID=1773489 RepID=A0A4R3J744_9PROT|nr:GcrA family cell cycle regulator [Varunaivibrio sulfuroxidans]TCS61678.1 GcrA cell cycle regulator [Varunaivibrio sulfuroxidans]WES32138.1 GcrA family cell cycle regulator [Varunaivibrio sulfuroxidans]